jgi:hypothetical protein
MTPYEQAIAYGLKVKIADLGAWAGGNELNSEYDARAGEIRINARIVSKLDGTERVAFVMHAIAHELYHHLETIGAVERLPERAARELAADAYARSLTERG